MQTTDIIGVISAILAVLLCWASIKTGSVTKTKICLKFGLVFLLMAIICFLGGW